MSTVTMTRRDALSIMRAGHAAAQRGGSPLDCPYSPNGDADERLRVAAWQRGYTGGTVGGAAALAAGGTMSETVADVPMGTTEPAADRPWHGVLAPEGVTSGDRRKFSPGALTWRDLPLPVEWQEQTAPGHDGAYVVGRIDTIERDADGLLNATGVWHDTPEADKAHDLVDDQMLRGLSVELDEDPEAPWVSHFEDGEGNPIEGDDWFWDELLGEGDGGVVIEVVDSGRICAVTLLPVPAFQEAFIANDPPADVPADCDPTDPEGDCYDPTAEPVDQGAALEPVALLARAGRVVVDHRLFTYPEALREGATACHVESDGRVFGHLAVWGTCHIGIEGTCVTPPSTATGYAHFLTGEVETDLGPVPVGQITMGTGHADPTLGLRAAVEHYDDTGTVIADVTVGEDETGIWYSGRIRPSVTPARLAEFTAGGALSGDWRRVGGHLELVAALAVNVPGFPVPRLQVAAAGNRQMSLVASGVVGPSSMAWRTGNVDVDALVAAVLHKMDRRERVHRLTRRVKGDRAERIARATAAVEGSE
jgi:hypothetical protein